MNPALPAPDEYRALGQALRVLRERVAMSQLEAAEQVGIGNVFISQIEHGSRGVRWHTLNALLRAYGADLHDLADAIEAGTE